MVKEEKERKRRKGVGESTNRMIKGIRLGDEREIKLNAAKLCA